MINKQNKIIVGIIALILALTVGYAIFFQSLNINGTAKAKASFGLIFENSNKTPTCRGYSGGDDCTIEQVASISEDGRTLTVTVDKLLYPTAYVKIPALIKNTGTVDAILESMEITGLDSDDIDVKYSITEEDIKNGYIVKPGNDNRKEVEIEVSWNKDSTYSSDTPLSITFNITMNYKQATNASITTTSSSNTNNCTEFTKKDTYAVGDLIAFCNTDTNKSEDFYVIKDNGDTVTALAKYNLMVGNMMDLEQNSIAPIPTNMEDYGLQSKKTIIEYDSNYNLIDNIVYGGIQFANKDENNKDSNNQHLGYWTNMTNSELGIPLEKYGTSYPANVFDENSLLWEPIQNYVNYIKNTMNKNTISGTLITNEQLIDLGCNFEEMSCSLAPAWVTVNLLSWTGSALNNNNISMFSFFAFGGEIPFYEQFLDNGIPYGVRPVITISKSEI